MLFIRSVTFVALFYLWSLIVCIVILPLLLAPRRWMIVPVRLWAGTTIALLRVICGVRLEFRGLQYLTSGPALIAAKHQCMFDTIAPVIALGDSCYVMRDSLLKIPFYGWYSMKQEMIPIDRDGHASALRRMLATAKARIAEGRQIVIFPEGHPDTCLGDDRRIQAPRRRVALYPGRPACGCVPRLATNSGEHWPAHGFIRRPGLIVYEFLEPIPAGLDRAAFMASLERRLEGASKALLGL